MPRQPDLLSRAWYWFVRPFRDCCDVQALNGEKAGAAAVIIYNSNKGQPPFPMAAPAGGADLQVPCCMTWASQGEEIARSSLFWELVAAANFCARVCVRARVYMCVVPASA